MLEEETIFDNLSDIGPSQSGLELIYTRLHLSHKSLTQIQAVSKYQQLQHVDLSHNSIHDVTPLGNLHNLLSLDMSHNKIKVNMPRSPPPPPPPPPPPTHTQEFANGFMPQNPPIFLNYKFTNRHKVKQLTQRLCYIGMA